MYMPVFVLELYYLKNTCGRHCNNSLYKHETASLLATEINNNITKCKFHVLFFLGNFSQSESTSYLT